MRGPSICRETRVGNKILNVCVTTYDSPSTGIGTLFRGNFEEDDTTSYLRKYEVGGKGARGGQCWVNASIVLPHTVYVTYQDRKILVLYLRTAVPNIPTRQL